MSQNQQILSISSDGVITAVYSDDLSELLSQGHADISRASAVEPDGCQWFADLSPVSGPKLGPFALRSHALAAEVSWLEDHITRL